MGTLPQRHPPGTSKGGRFAPGSHPTDPDLADSITEPESPPSSVVTGTTVIGASATWACRNGKWEAEPSWDTTLIGVQTAVSGAANPTYRFHVAAEQVVFSEIVAELLNSGDLSPEMAGEAFSSMCGSVIHADLTRNWYAAFSFAARLSVCEHLERWGNVGSLDGSQPLDRRLRAILPAGTQYASGTRSEDSVAADVLHDVAHLCRYGPEEWADLSKQISHLQEMAPADLSKPLSHRAQPSLAHLGRTTGFGTAFGDETTLARLYDRYIKLGANRSCHYGSQSRSWPGTWAPWVMMSKARELDSDAAALTDWMRTTGPTHLRAEDFGALVQHATRLKHGWTSTYRRDAAAALAAGCAAISDRKNHPFGSKSMTEGWQQWFDPVQNPPQADTLSYRTRAERLVEVLQPHKEAAPLSAELNHYLNLRSQRMPVAQ